MENASSAFLDAVRKSMRAIRSAIGSTTITPELLTSAEKLRYESYLRREVAAANKKARIAWAIMQRGGTAVRNRAKKDGLAMK